MVSSTRHLLSKCGMPGLALRRADRRVDEVLHALFARGLGEALALLFFALDAGLPGVLHGERAPGAVERGDERRGVVQIAGDDLDALLGERAAGVAVGLAGHGAELEVAAGEVTERARHPACRWRP